ncbi:hypothetical protein FOL46_008542 [Perkinsus olseni]|uniref:Uncharacterized protein n=1 Tax=Perkinsus olseni TaxID=32597 RepID=A0A7J6L6H9_PEROL|nr:hypothetical protein FOL46_008542 [Perkinsus olseni]
MVTSFHPEHTHKIENAETKATHQHQQPQSLVIKSERTLSASTTADAGSPSAIPRLPEDRRPRRESEDSVKSKLELAIRRTSCSPLINAGTKSAPDGTLLVYRTESMATAVKANAFLKTKMCPKLIMNANGVWTCPQGDRCSFAHAESELRSLPNLTKTAICYEQVYGKCGCKNGARCKYAHSEEELRKYVPQGVPPGRQFNSKSPGHPRHGSGDSTSWLKRRGSRSSEGPYISSGGGRRYSKESILSGIKLGSPKPKPIDLPALQTLEWQIARELPASTGKHLEISRGQLVDKSDDPCIEQYLCSICGALASPTPDPTIASACTHVTCARCFEGWRRANVEQEPKLKTLPCPSCGCPLRKGIDVFPLDESVEGPIAALRRVYSKIQIGCNKTDDVTAMPCTWIGSVRDFPEHMVVCHHWECLLKTLPSFTCKDEEDAEEDTTPQRAQAPHFYDVLDDPQETVPVSGAQVDIAPIWDDISPTGRPIGHLKSPPTTTTTTHAAGAGTSMAKTGFNEQVLILSPPARGIDSYGDRSAAASPSTTATIPGAPGNIWAPQQVDTYSATSSNCSEMIASISPDNFFPSAAGNCLGEDSDNTDAEECVAWEDEVLWSNSCFILQQQLLLLLLSLTGLDDVCRVRTCALPIGIFRLDSAYCEAICAFVPYGSSADKMLEMSEGEALLYNSVTDDGQWSLVKRVATGEQGWVPTGYLQVASDEMSPPGYRSLGYNAALTPENSNRALGRDPPVRPDNNNNNEDDDDDDDDADLISLAHDIFESPCHRDVPSLYYTDVQAGAERPPLETADSFRAPSVGDDSLLPPSCLDQDSFYTRPQPTTWS